MLAGGRSTRFGADKLAAGYRGAPLLHHAIRRVAEVCDEVLVVIPPSGAPPPVPEGLTVHLARDAREGEGPLAGLAGALGLVGTTRTLVVAGDMPELHAGVLGEMLRVADEAAADAVALRDGDVVRPLPCVVATAIARRHAIALLRSGERSLRALVDSLRTAVIDESTWRALDPSGGTLLDVDTPSDLPLP